MTMILNFHGVGVPGPEVDPDEAEVWVDRPRFESILDWAAGRDDVAITFDDGNASDCDVALPALVDRGLSAAFFVVAARIDRDRYLGRAQLAALRDAGMTIGSHGMAHRPWRHLTPADERAELVEARERIEQAAACPVREAACPFGRYDRRTIAALRRAGFVRAYTSDRAMASMRGLLQPRFTMKKSDSGETVDRLHAAESRAVRRCVSALRIAAKRIR